MTRHDKALIKCSVGAVIFTMVVLAISAFDAWRTSCGGIPAVMAFTIDIFIAMLSATVTVLIYGVIDETHNK